MEILERKAADDVLPGWHRVCKTTDGKRADITNYLRNALTLAEKFSQFFIPIAFLLIIK